jgi:hypothetical protein
MDRLIGLAKSFFHKPVSLGPMASDLGQRRLPACVSLPQSRCGRNSPAIYVALQRSDQYPSAWPERTKRPSAFLFLQLVAGFYEPSNLPETRRRAGFSAAVSE